MENYYKNKDVKKYCQKTDNPNYNLYHFETPFRSLVVAPSVSGKSNFITNLIAFRFSLSFPEHSLHAPNGGLA